MPSGFMSAPSACTSPLTTSLEFLEGPMCAQYRYWKVLNFWCFSAPLAPGWLMPNSTILSDVQPFPASSRGTCGMRDRLNLAFFSCLPCIWLFSAVLLSWLCAFYPLGERDVGLGGRIQALGHSWFWDHLTGFLSAFRAGRKELRLTSGKMPISHCTKLQTGLDSCSKSS